MSRLVTLTQLHLKSKGSGELAINITKNNKKWKRSWQVTNSFLNNDSTPNRSSVCHSKISDNLTYRIKYFRSKESYQNNEPDKLNEVRPLNPDMLTIAHANIYSLRNKFEMLQTIIIIGKVDILLIKEAK